MTQQPNDVVSHWAFDKNRFETLSTALSFRDDFQTTTSKPDIDPGKYSPSQSGELLDINIANGFIDDISDSCATPTLAPSYSHSEQSFPECQFDEFDLLDPFADPINKCTITTTTSGAEDSNNDDTIYNTLPELHLTPDEIENFLKEPFEEFCLESIDNSIEQRTMFIATQPPPNLRPRYKSDGTRQIEKARTKPMVVKLPNLKDIQLDPHQLFLLRLSLITYNENQSDQVHLHANKLEYHSNNVQELDDGTVGVPLTEDEMKDGEKALPRLSIVKAKLDAYKRELAPYNLSGKLDMNKNENEKISVKTAKDIFKQFNMKASRIACQLLIKQNKSLHFTNITCETHVLKEKDQKNSNKTKRSANTTDSDEEESLDDYPSPSKAKSVKRTKRSNY